MWLGYICYFCFNALFLVMSTTNVSRLPALLRVLQYVAILPVTSNNMDSNMSLLIRIFPSLSAIFYRDTYKHANKFSAPNVSENTPRLSRRSPVAFLLSTLRNIYVLLG